MDLALIDRYAKFVEAFSYFNVHKFFGSFVLKFNRFKIGFLFPHFDIDIINQYGHFLIV